MILKKPSNISSQERKMARNKTKIKDTLDEFLFRQIENDPEFQLFANDYVIPDYITDNISKTLRPYQELALKYFIFLYDKNRADAKHLLFNMATGTGKTLVMACCILFLYEKGYRNFLFLVHQIQIKSQAEKNFTDYKFEKYLFNPKGVKINGRNVSVRVIDNFSDSSVNTINFMFFSTSLLYHRLKEDRENGLTAEDFENNDVVVIADEAHRLNVDTRSKNKKDKEEILNWESAVLSAISAREENILLEFTATVDLANENIWSKYKDKLVFRYDFLQFNRDGYSKDVKFLYNNETNIEDQKRLLIVNAVALSEYRRLLAERTMGVEINPIVLIKSTKVKASEEDRKFFDTVISSLRPDDLRQLQKFAKDNKGREYEILDDMFKWIADKNNGLINAGDWDGLNSFVAMIRANFAHENTLIYNNQTKERADLLPLLDSPRNQIRAIFSVNALNEGWDVLSLYDIVHFDISEGKKVSLQDIQLIGRGARYCPYELPKSYIRDEGGLFDSMRRNLETDKYKRKFDNDPMDKGRVLETFVYHFVKTGVFLENLQRDLLGEGIINDGVEKKTIQMKEQFMASDTYKKGFVLVNKTIKRKKTSEEDIDTTFNKVLKAGSYNLRARALSDWEQNSYVAEQRNKTIRINEEFFPKHLVEKALMGAENGFFRFNNLREHIVGLKTIDTLVDEYLPKYEIKYTYEEGKDIGLLNPQEKLQLLVGVILPEVRKSIDLNMPKIIGDNRFRPVSLKSIFGQEKSIYLTSFPVEDTATGEKVFISNDERSKAQTDNPNAELAYDVKSAEWYAYDENYGTSEEKKFVKWMASQVGNLRREYPTSEIYVIRNELDYWLFSPADGRRFCPDYMLIVNDVENKAMYYQCLIEPKGGHILLQDAWKEEALIDLNENSKVSFASSDGDKKNYADYLEEIKSRGYQEIKNIGLKFFNSDTRGAEDFALDFEEKLLSKS